MDAHAAPTRPRTPGWVTALGWTLAGLISLVLVWRVVVVNVSAMFALDAETAPEAAVRGVAWDARNSDALLREADTFVDQEPARARQLAKRALAANPANARAFLVLARLATADRAAYADLLARSADLDPQNVPTRLALTDLAIRQGDVRTALINLDAALRARPVLLSDVQPQLLALLDTQAGEVELRRFFQHAVPPWWQGLMGYASAQAPTAQLPLRLLDIRRDFSPAPGLAERQPVVARLARDAEWQSAFMVWMNGLTPEQRRATGNVYNGGFEMPFTDTTFDWRRTPRNGVEVEALPTFGTTGARALRLAFQGQIKSPELIGQTLLLAPGFSYELRARYRLESVRTQFGLEWEVSCGESRTPTVIASGDRHLGTTDWRDFTVKFAVPARCYPQHLALVLRGDAKLDLQAAGLAWFDDLQVVRGDAAEPVRAPVTIVPPVPSAAAGRGLKSKRSRTKRKG